MMHYLLSASLIWLISLLIYELLLKRDTFHSWNRAYLLLTLVLGLILPNISWQKAAEAPPEYIRIPVARVHAVRETVESATTITYTATRHQLDWPLIIYSFGLLITVMLVLREVIGLIALVKGAKRTKYPSYTILETGKQHGPFSFFNWIMLNSMNDYEPEELQMILTHEARHIRLLHSLDMVCMQILRVIFWFHPLIWWYQKRLQLVHEYQADYRERPKAGIYGRFLIEQQMLQHTPSFAHSFFHSPIKNRIKMLTKSNSTKTSLAKYLLVLPMAAVLMLACNKYNEAPKKEVKGKIVKFKGNEFEMSKVIPQTITFIDSSGKKKELSFDINQYPIKMNGEKIYLADSARTFPVFNGPKGGLAYYLYSKTKDKFDKLNDGAWHIMMFNNVVDTKGNLAYYEAPQLLPYYPPEDRSKDFLKDGVFDFRNANIKRMKPSDDTLFVKDLRRSLFQVLNKETIKYNPAYLKGKPVICMVDDKALEYRIVVKKHQSTFEFVPLALREDRP